MSVSRTRVAALILFCLALAALLLYRPLLKAIGYDLDRTVPEWAGFMGPREYDDFMAQVEEYFAGKGIQVRLLNGRAYPEYGGEFSLRTLAQRCHRSTRKDWPGEIERYFREAQDAQEDNVDQAP